MNILEIIKREAENRELSFMVIGGHAVNAHQFSRRTEDLDLLIRKTNRDAWCEVMETLGYSIFHDGGNFLQFRPPTSGDWPVDFMLVVDATFHEMLAKSVKDKVEQVEVSLPCIPHLVAMKLHAINHGPPHREMGDLHDIIMILQQNKIDIESKEMQDFLRNTGTPIFMSESEKYAENDAQATKVAETHEGLDFPVNRDFGYNPPVVSLSEMFARGTERMRREKSAYQGEERRKQNRCYKEFVL